MPRHPYKQIKDITFGVSTAAASLEPLLLTLSSVLNGSLLPAGVIIRFEGKLPLFGSYYLEQLACFAQTQGVEWTMVVDNSQGIRHARDWLVANCPTPYLWMGDDDVVYEHGCLAAFAEKPVMWRSDLEGQVAAFAGIKVDATNRRGYPDYDNKEETEFNPAKLGPACLNHYYVKSPTLKLDGTQFSYLDSGNCMLDVELLRQHKIKFQVFADSVPNSGGEDTVFAAKLLKSGFVIMPVLTAQSCHLEKPKVLFNDISARAELVKRSVSQL